jgi:hypothetical protein
MRKMVRDHIGYAIVDTEADESYPGQIVNRPENREIARFLLTCDDEIIDETGLDLRGKGLPMWQTHAKIGEFLAWAKHSAPQFVACYHLPCCWGEFFIGETAKGDLCLLQDDPEMPGYQAWGWTDPQGSYAGMDLPALITHVLTGCFKNSPTQA